MDKNRKNIDQFFREQLAGARETPPASVWEDLEEKLKDKPSKRGAAGKGFVLSLIALVIVIGGVAYLRSGSSLPDLHHKAPQVPFTDQASGMSDQEETNDNPAAKAALPLVAEQSASGNAVQPQNKQEEAHTHIASKTTSGSGKNNVVGYTSSSGTKDAPKQNKTLQQPVLAADQQSLASKGTVREVSALNKAKPKQTAPKPVQAEPASAWPVANSIGNDRNTANVPVSDQESVTAENRVPMPATNTEKLQPEIVMHNVEFKGPEDTPLAKQPIHTPEQAIAVKSKVAGTIPAVATEMKMPGNPPKTADSKETVISSKVASLSEKGIKPDIAVKLPAAQKLPVAEEQKIRKSLNLFLGIKAGYETGFSSFTSGKYVGSLFGEVQVTERWSFLLQPSIKVAQVNRTLIQGGNYIRAGETTSSLFNVRGDDSSGFTYDYAYWQTYDSMITSVELKKNFTEFELPLFFRYTINRQLSAMAGLNFTFGKLVLWDNKVQTISGLSITDTVLNTPDTIAPAASAKFAHAGSTPFTDYKPSALPANTNPVRFGYSLGLSYTLRDRLMLDLLLQQNLSGYQGIRLVEARQLFSQAYLRLSVGYKLFGAGKK